MAKKRKATQPQQQQQQQPQPEPVQQLQPEPVQQPPKIEEPAQTQPETEPEPEQQPEEQIVQEVKVEAGDAEDDAGGDQNDAVPEPQETSNVAVKAEEKSNDAVNGDGAGEENEDDDDDDVDEDEEDLEDEPLEKLLEPFTKDQMVALIKDAVAKYPGIMTSVRILADKDPAHRKIFVHGLGWDANGDTLTSVFAKYGEIEDCKAVTDKVSGKSKGYGFILFKHRSGAQKALREPQKKIGNRMTSCQLASTGPVPAPPPTVPPVSEYTQRKIFVSNVGPELDPGKLTEFFAKYGEIEDGPLGLDKQTGKPKGFCLFVYKSVEGAKKALEEPHKHFEGHVLNCHKAIDGPKPGKNYNSYPQQQHQPHPHYPQQQYYQHTSKKAKYSGGSNAGGVGASPGHLMAPSGPAVGLNPAVAPALGQALSALLASQGAGLGIGNLLGVNPQGVPPVNQGGYGAQGGYGGQPVMQGGYQNPQMGQGGARPQQGGAPYMGHGH